MDKLEYAITYDIVTPESAECGDFEETGFEHESIVFDTFSELYTYIAHNGLIYPSVDPVSSFDEQCWISNNPDVNYETGAEKTLSIHPKNERATKYLLKAYKMTN